MGVNEMKKIIGILIFTLVLLSSISTASNLQYGCNNILTSAEENIPDFLDGTVLDGSKNIIISEDGSPPAYLDSKYYDVVISKEERDEIVQNAREDYIEKYRIDPFEKEESESMKSTNKFQNIGQLLEELKTNNNKKCNPTIDPLGSNYGPYELRDENGDSKLYIYIIYAWGNLEVDESDKANCRSDIKIAVNRLKSKFNVAKHEILEFYGKNYWNARDCTNDADDQYNDLEEDCDYLRCDRSNVLLFGWSKYATKSGRSNFGYHCIAHRGFTWFIDKYDLAQHELSHCFGAPDHGHVLRPKCIMGYIWLFFGLYGYCNDCNNIIKDQMHTEPETKGVYVQFYSSRVKSVIIDEEIITFSKPVFLDEGEYTIRVFPEDGYTFDYWEPTGCVLVEDKYSHSTTISVTGFDDPPLDGWLKVNVN